MVKKLSESLGKWNYIIDASKRKDQKSLEHPVQFKCFNLFTYSSLVDIESVRFLLHAEIAFEVIGILFKKYRVRIVMVDKKGC